MTPFGLPVHPARLATRIATMGASFAAVAALATGASPMAAAQYAAIAAPKAYVGLFGDNAIGVIDTASNQVTKTIPVPTGPHGLVITPDNKWVYASSDGDSVVSVINTATDEVTGIAGPPFGGSTSRRKLLTGTPPAQPGITTGKDCVTPAIPRQATLRASVRNVFSRDCISLILSAQVHPNIMIVD